MLIGSPVMENKPSALALRTFVVAACTLYHVSVLLLVASVAHAAAGAQATPKPLTNNDVVSMVQAGLPTDVILEKIKTSKTDFSTSTESLIALKKAGISPDIIRMMINPAAEPAAPSTKGPFGANANAPAPCQSSSVGGQPSWLTGASPAMWFMEPEKADRTEISYERGTITRVGFAGFGASLLDLHSVKASVRLSSGSKFVSCINPNDAPLVHFNIDKKGDERNTSVGKITPFNQTFHISDEDMVRFKFEKTPEGYYVITPEAPLAPGEYGFVPQGSMGFFAAGERVYAFGVD